MTSHEDERPFFDLVPPVLRSRQLGAFARRVLDHVFRRRASKRVVGHAGRRPSWWHPETEHYIQLSDSQRETVGFAPAHVLVDTSEGREEPVAVVDFAHWRERVESGGARITDALKTAHYSWHPPIDADKFVNWHRYVWVPSGIEPLEITAPTDLRNNVVGKVTATVPGPSGPVQLSSGMLIRPIADVDPEISDRTWVVEGVGRSIVLVPLADAQDCAWDRHPWSEECVWDGYPLAPDDEPDYVTIERGCVDRNAWSLGNRWFHEDVVPNLAELSYRRARGPIIEFRRDIELYDHGWHDRGNVDIVAVDCDDILGILRALDPSDPTYASVAAGASSVTCVELTVDPTDTTWEFAHLGISDVRLGGANLADGMRILITGSGPLGDRVWTVTGIASLGRIVLIMDTSGGDPTGAPARGDRVTTRAADGTPENWWYDGTQWRKGQTRTGRGSIPLFRLYDADRVALDDPGVYPGSDFAGSTIFEYAIDTDPGARVDPDIGLRVLRDSEGRILFRNDLALGEWTREQDGERIPLPASRWWHRLPESPDGELFSDSWHRLDGDAPLFHVRTRPASEGPDFVLDNDPLPPGDDPGAALRETMTVELAGRRLEYGTEWTLVDRTVSIDPTVLESGIERAVTIRWRPANPDATVGVPFEIPLPWATNPWNEDPGTIAWDDLYAHFTGAIAQTDGVSGDASGSNTYRDSSKDMRRGPVVLRWEHAPWLSAVLLAAGIDPAQAVRRAGEAYERGVRRLFETIRRLDGEGEYALDATAADRVLGAARRLAVGRAVRRPYHDSTAIEPGLAFPLSAAHLGLVPPRPPEMVTVSFGDFSLTWIEGHDGSRIQARGDSTDDEILAFEQAMYDSLPPDVAAMDSWPDWMYDILPGRFRGEAPPAFYEALACLYRTWAYSHGDDPYANIAFESDNPWTWNWSTAPSFDGQPLRGYWRGIYLDLFDTEFPNLRPWEMLGFSREPSWWRATYGDPPYTRGNIALWQDLEQGVVRDGPRAGTDPRFARPGLLDILPVDDVGRLLDPLAAGIAKAPPDPLYAAAPFRPGDMSPLEHGWYRSPSGRFAVAYALLRARPGSMVDALWDPPSRRTIFVEYGDAARATVLPDGTRPSRAATRVHDPLADPPYEASGVQRCVIESLRTEGIDGPAKLRDVLNSERIRPALALEGFVDGSNLRITRLDSLSEIEDVSRIFLADWPVGGVDAWSAIAIDPMVSGWVVWGWDWCRGSFPVLDLDDHGPKIVFEVGTESVPVREWDEGSTYTRGEYVHYNSTYWQATADTVAGETPATGPWKKVGSDQLTRARIRIAVPSRPHPSGTEREVLYGTVFESLEDVARFVVGYQRALEKRGFVFDDVAPGPIGSFRSWLGLLLDDPAPMGSVLGLPTLRLKYMPAHGDVDRIDRVRGILPPLSISGDPIRADDIDVMRDLPVEITFRSAEESVPDLPGLMPIARRETRHVIVLDEIDPDGRPLYVRITGDTEERLHVDAVVVANWNGRLDAPGFLVTPDGMLPTPETQTSRIRYLYDPDREETEDFSQRRRAMHLLGWQPRSWMRRLLLSDRTQYKFYTGAVRHKGTLEVTDALARSSWAVRDFSLDIGEEWLIRLASYGGTGGLRSMDFEIDPARLSSAPQIVTLTEREVPAEVDVETWIADNLRDDPPARHPMEMRVYVRDGALVGTGPGIRAVPRMPTDSVATPWPVIGWQERRNRADVLLPLTPDERGTDVRDVDSLLDALRATLETGGPPEGSTWYVHRSAGISARQRIEAGYPTLLAAVDVPATVLSIAPYLPPADSPLDRTRTWVEIVFDTDVAGASGTAPIGPGDIVVFAGIDEDGNPWPLSDVTTVGDVGDGKTIRVAADVLTGNTLSFGEDSPSSMGAPPRVIVFRRLVFTDMDDLSNVLASDYLPETLTDGAEADFPAFVRDARTHAQRTAHGAAFETPTWAVGRITARVWKELRRPPRDVPDNRRARETVHRRVDGGEIARIEPWDPLVGVWPSAMATEIDVHAFSDPAVYGSGDPERDRIDEGGAWGPEHAGFRWLDLSSFAYEDWHAYEETIDRRGAIGQIAAFSDPVVWEWTGSELPPDRWARRTGGRLLRTTDTPHTVHTDDRGRTTYWFWAGNPTTVPEGRRLSASALADAIVDPFRVGVRWWSILSAETVAVHVDGETSAGRESVLRVRWRLPDAGEEPTHADWVLLTEGLPGIPVPADIHARFVDSLAAGTEDGQPVPDPSIPEADRYGNDLHVRRSWFRDLSAARGAVASAFDALASRIALEDSQAWWYGALVAGDPEPLEGYDVRVAGIAERDLLRDSMDVPAGMRVLVAAEPATAHFWTLWESDGSGGWTLVDIQRWNLDDLWEWADWYGPDADPDSPPVAVFRDATARDLGDPPAEGTLIVVEDDGSGRWVWQRSDGSGGWTDVARENATIRLSDFARSTGRSLEDALGTDDPAVVADIVRGRDPGREWREFFRVLSTNVLPIEDLPAKLLFAALRHVVATDTSQDWIRRSHTIVARTGGETLEASTRASRDIFPSLADFLEEMRPFHVQLRDIRRLVGPPPDEATADITDFDLPVHPLNGVLDPGDPADLAIIQSEAPWTDWWSAYNDEPDRIRAIDVGIEIARASCDTELRHPLRLIGSSSGGRRLVIDDSNFHGFPTIPGYVTREEGPRAWNRSNVRSVILRDPVAGTVTELPPGEWDIVEEDGAAVLTTNSDVPAGVEVVLVRNADAVERIAALWTWTDRTARGDLLSLPPPRREDIPRLAGCDFRGTVLEGGPFLLDVVVWALIRRGYLRSMWSPGPDQIWQELISSKLPSDLLEDVWGAVYGWDITGWDEGGLVEHADSGTFSGFDDIFDEIVESIPLLGSLNPWDTVYDGPVPDDPRTGPGTPGELAPLRIFSPVVLDVYHSASDGVPTVTTTSLIANGSETVFPWEGLAQSRQALFVHRDGLLLTEGIDYTVDWARAEVIFPTPPPAGTVITIFEIGYGGANRNVWTTIAEWSDVDGTGTLATDIPESLQQHFVPGNILATVGGRPLQVTATSGSDVTFAIPTPLPAPSETVIVATFTGPDFARVHTAQYVYSAIGQVFPLPGPVGTRGPTESGVMVRADGALLVPPEVLVYGPDERALDLHPLGGDAWRFEIPPIWHRTVKLAAATFSPIPPFTPTFVDDRHFVPLPPERVRTSNTTAVIHAEGQPFGTHPFDGSIFGDGPEIDLEVPVLSVTPVPGGSEVRVDLAAARAVLGWWPTSPVTMSLTVSRLADPAELDIVVEGTSVPASDPSVRAYLSPDNAVLWISRDAVAEDDRVDLVITSGAEWTMSSGQVAIAPTVAPPKTLTVTTVSSPFDAGIETRRYAANALGLFEFDGPPASPDHVRVWVDGRRLHHGSDYIVKAEEGDVWDAGVFDGEAWNRPSWWVEIHDPPPDGAEIVIAVMHGIPAMPPTALRHVVNSVYGNETAALGQRRRYELLADFRAGDTTLDIVEMPRTPFAQPTDPPPHAGSMWIGADRIDYYGTQDLGIVGGRRAWRLLSVRRGARVSAGGVRDQRVVAWGEGLPVWKPWTDYPAGSTVIYDGAAWIAAVNVSAKAGFDPAEWVPGTPITDFDVTVLGPDVCVQRVDVEIIDYVDGPGVWERVGWEETPWDVDVWPGEDRPLNETHEYQVLTRTVGTQTILYVHLLEILSYDPGRDGPRLRITAHLRDWTCTDVVHMAGEVAVETTGQIVPGGLEAIWREGAGRGLAAADGAATRFLRSRPGGPLPWPADVAKPL